MPLRPSIRRARSSKWAQDGKDALLVDLDRPETFREALTGVDRLFLSTGYTVAMVHQSKTIVDAAADAGVSFTAEISKGLDLSVKAIVLTPDDLVKQVSNGAMTLPSFVEATYGAGILELGASNLRRAINFKGATSTVEDVTGRKPQTLEMWVRANRQAVLSAAS
jgi:hypothetical protein